MLGEPGARESKGHPPEDQKPIEQILAGAIAGMPELFMPDAADSKANEHPHDDKASDTSDNEEEKERDTGENLALTIADPGANIHSTVPTSRDSLRGGENSSTAIHQLSIDDLLATDKAVFESLPQNPSLFELVSYLLGIIDIIEKTILATFSHPVLQNGTFQDRQKAISNCMKWMIGLVAPTFASAAASYPSLSGAISPILKLSTSIINPGERGDHLTTEEHTKQYCQNFRELAVSLLNKDSQLLSAMEKEETNSTSIWLSTIAQLQELGGDVPQFLVDRQALPDTTANLPFSHFLAKILASPPALNQPQQLVQWLNAFRHIIKLYYPHLSTHELHEEINRGIKEKTIPSHHGALLLFAIRDEQNNEKNVADYLELLKAKRLILKNRELFVDQVKVYGTLGEQLASSFLPNMEVNLYDFAKKSTCNEHDIAIAKEIIKQYKEKIEPFYSVDEKHDEIHQYQSIKKDDPALLVYKHPEYFLSHTWQEEAKNFSSPTISESQDRQLRKLLLSGNYSLQDLCEFFKHNVMFKQHIKNLYIQPEKREQITSHFNKDRSDMAIQQGYHSDRTKAAVIVAIYHDYFRQEPAPPDLRCDQELKQLLENNASLEELIRFFDNHQDASHRVVNHFFKNRPEIEEFIDLEARKHAINQVALPLLSAEVDPGNLGRVFNNLGIDTILMRFEHYELYTAIEQELIKNNNVCDVRFVLKQSNEVVRKIFDDIKELFTQEFEASIRLLKQGFEDKNYASFIGIFLRLFAQEVGDIVSHFPKDSPVTLIANSIISLAINQLCAEILNDFVDSTDEFDFDKVKKKINELLDEEIAKVAIGEANKQLTYKTEQRMVTDSDEVTQQGFMVYQATLHYILNDHVGVLSPPVKDLIRQQISNPILTKEDKWFLVKVFFQNNNKLPIAATNGEFSLESMRTAIDEYHTEDEVDPAKKLRRQKQLAAYLFDVLAGTGIGTNVYLSELLIAVERLFDLLGYDQNKKEILFPLLKLKDKLPEQSIIINGANLLTLLELAEFTEENKANPDDVKQQINTFIARYAARDQVPSAFNIGNAIRTTVPILKKDDEDAHGENNKDTKEQRNVFDNMLQNLVDGYTANNKNTQSTRAIRGMIGADKHGEVFTIQDKCQMIQVLMNARKNNPSLLRSVRPDSHRARLYKDLSKLTKHKSTIDNLLHIAQAYEHQMHKAIVIQDENILIDIYLKAIEELGDRTIDELGVPAVVAYQNYNQLNDLLNTLERKISNLGKSPGDIQKIKFKLIREIINQSGILGNEKEEALVHFRELIFSDTASLTEGQPEKITAITNAETLATSTISARDLQSDAFVTALAKKFATQGLMKEGAEFFAERLTHCQPAIMVMVDNLPTAEQSEQEQPSDEPFVKLEAELRHVPLRHTVSLFQNKRPHESIDTMNYVLQKRANKNLNDVAGILLGISCGRNETHLVNFGPLSIHSRLKDAIAGNDNYQTLNKAVADLPSPIAGN